MAGQWSEAFGPFLGQRRASLRALAASPRCSDWSSREGDRSMLAIHARRTTRELTSGRSR
jgi:hypothetical protein